MDFHTLAQSRRSVRDFTGQPLTPRQIEKLLQAAQAAPSGGNCQPWHFYVIQDKAVKTQAVERSRASKFCLAAPVLFVVCADPARSEARYGQRGRELYALQDTAAAVQNLLLCAQDMGLGACWCGAFDEAALAAALGLPAHLRPVAMVPVGYPTTEQCCQIRRPLSEVVTFIGGAETVLQEPERKPLRFEHMEN